MFRNKSLKVNILIWKKKTNKLANVLNLTFPFFLRNPEYFTYMDVIHVHDAYLEIFHVQVRFFTSMYLCELRSNYVQLRSNYVQLRSITFKLRSNYVQLRSITFLAYISKTIVGKSRPG